MSCEYAALTDEERGLMETIEADLDREMAVEPSPDFAARVRERISAADRDSGWSVPWAFAAAAVVTIATGILLAGLRGQPVDAPAIVAGHDVALPAPTSPGPIAAASRPAVTSWRVPSSQASKASAGSRIDRRIARAAEPEVLVPDDLRVAIGRVMRMVHAGTLNPTRDVDAAGAGNQPAVRPERATAAVEEPAEPFAPMVVEELQVPPINLAGGGVEKGFGLY